MNTSFITPRAGSPAFSPDGSRTRSGFTTRTGIAPRRRLRWLIPPLLGASALSASAIPEFSVTNDTNFKSHAEAAGAERLVLTADITLSTGVTVRREKVIVFGRFQIKEHASTPATLTINGTVEAPRQQIFGDQSTGDWEPGDIKGDFANSEIYPEWWGLTANHHDIAINCAVQTSDVNGGIPGHVVSLAPGRYDVSAPIDMSRRKTVLQGAGSGRTSVVAATTWSDPAPANFYMWGPGNNHSAMVWMGSEIPSNQTYFTGVRGIDFSCYNAAIASPGVRISGISSRAFVEENSFVENVGVSYFTGFGIGFGGSANGTVGATINGLQVRNFWLTGGMAKDAFPIYFTHHAGVCSVQNGTIDMTSSHDHSQRCHDVTPAKSTLTITGNPADGDKVTIGDKDYVFKTSLTGTPPSNTVWVLRDQTAGSGYSARMTAVKSVTGTSSGATVTLRSNVAGPAGALACSASTSPASNVTFTGGGTSATLAVPGGGNAQTDQYTTAFTFNSTPAAGSWVDIGTYAYTSGGSLVTVYSKRYTFVSSAPSADGEVLINGTSGTAFNLAQSFIGAAQNSLFNLAMAVNNYAGYAGYTFTTGVGMNPYASASLPEATQVIGSRGAVSAGDTVTVGATVYTFHDSPSGAGSGQIQRVSHDQKFSNNTSPHPDATAVDNAGPHTATVTAKVLGFNGHLPIYDSSAAGKTARLSLPSATLTGGYSGTVPQQASITFSFSGQPDDGSSITVGVKTYTFKNTLTQTADGEVKIGASVDVTRANLATAFRGAAYDSLANLASAINNGTATVAANNYMKAGAVKNDSFTLTSFTSSVTGAFGNRTAVRTTGSALTAGGSYAEGGVPHTSVKLTAIYPGAAGAFTATATPAGGGWNVLSWSAQTPGENSFDPPYVRHSPLVGIRAAGKHTSVDNVHIEGTTIGLMVSDSWAAPSQVTVSNLDTWAMLEGDMQYWTDPSNVIGIPPSLQRQKATYPHPLGWELHYSKYATSVLICGQLVGITPVNGINVPDRASLTNIGSLGNTTYLLRDGVYNIEHSAFGHTQVPNGAYSGFTFYARGDAWRPPATNGTDFAATWYYDKSQAANAFPNNLKTYFLGPIE